MASSISVAGVSGESVVLRAGPTSLAHPVVFFEGDQITDEDTLEILGTGRCSPAGHLNAIAARFPDSPVLLVMPTSVVAGGQACFGNFICASTATGEPLGFKPQEYRAAAHLRAILAASGLDATAAALELVGFSKGAVVLNQLLTEMAWHEEARANTAGADPGAAAAGTGASAGASAAPAPGAPLPSGASGPPLAARGVASGAAPRPAPPDDARLLDSIRTVHFLDAGLNSRGVHLTDAAVVHHLGRRHQRLPLDLHLHGTPRQWADRKRPWIAAEKKRFAEMLEAEGVSAREAVYFAGQPGTLKQHFDIIAAMQPHADATN